MKLNIKRINNNPGDVLISGAKNSSLAIICAAILCNGEVILDNVPDIVDVQTLFTILRSIGYHVEFINNTARIVQVKKIPYRIKNEHVTKMRGSYYFMGALLAKLHRVSIASSGGCNLGKRPIDFHINGFKKMGAKYSQKNDIITLKAKKLTPTHIHLNFPSVGATINLMLAATKTIGTTTISNCAKEPEIIDVANFLKQMGAKIEGAGTDTITINGVYYLNPVRYKIIADRIEAGTYLILGALLDGVKITGIKPIYIKSLIDLLTNSGYNIEANADTIILTKAKQPQPFTIATGPYPDFPTDLGQPLSVLATQIEGQSQIIETIFKNRYSHVEALISMGADINVIDNTININGKTPLTPKEVTAYDLRGAAALVLAGSLNNTNTIINNIDVFLRGYENPVAKLASFGIQADFTN